MQLYAIICNGVSRKCGNGRSGSYAPVVVCIVTISYCFFFFSKLSIQAKYQISREFGSYVQEINGFRLASMYKPAYNGHNAFAKQLYTEVVDDYKPYRHKTPCVTKPALASGKLEYRI